MSLTNEKKSFYKFKNKVDLTNKETFGYFAEENPLNNELFVYLNSSLDGSVSKSITNYNLDYNINNIVKLFWDNRLNASDVRKFYDSSIFTGGTQPSLTEYMEYKGNIFELYERLTQYTKDKVVREQEVKSKYLNWFDPLFLTAIGLERISKYIFNLASFANNNINGTRKLNNVDLVYKFNEYFRIKTNNDLQDKDMFVLANSNSIRPSRIYYKKITTETLSGIFENKFIFPLYLGNDITLLTSITGMSVLRNVNATEVKQSVNY